MGRESWDAGTVSDGMRAVHDRGIPAVLGRTGCAMVHVTGDWYVRDVSGLGRQVPGIVPSKD
jgi:hypothetical protein